LGGDVERKVHRRMARDRPCHLVGDRITHERCARGA